MFARQAEMSASRPVPLLPAEAKKGVLRSKPIFKPISFGPNALRQKCPLRGRLRSPWMASVRRRSAEKTTK
jgi:hypothetical protein